MIDMSTYRIQSFLVLIHKYRGEGQSIGSDPEYTRDQKTWILHSVDHRIEMLAIFRNEEQNPQIHDSASSPRIVTLTVGDKLGRRDTYEECTANSATLRIDFTHSVFKVWTSVVGLPPVYCMEEDRFFVFTTDIHLLKNVSGLHPMLDPKGMIELGRTGHPTEYGTLVKDLTMLPGGQMGEYRHASGFRLTNAWEIPEEKPVKDWERFCKSQIDAFDRSMGKIKTEGAFLSLTAGLDTRAIFSWLINQREFLPSYTMSGPELSLDARIAQSLCNHYGVKHQVISLKEDFFQNILVYMKEASRLSGGVVSLGQAAEVYFYEQINNELTSRISGNLGNQIGRGGTEGISLRSADLGILRKEILFEYKDSLNKGHWFFNRGENDNRMSYRTLLQYEVPHSSVANYSIGNHFLVQKSPYASIELIEASCRDLEWGREKSDNSLIRMRQRDLLHRFLGEPCVKSFQRQLIRDYGGYPSICPINWGWRANGGISLKGILFGVCTGLDAFFSRNVTDAKSVALRKSLHVYGLHDFKNIGYWIKMNLRGYILDYVHSSGSATDIFEKPVLQKKVMDYFLGKSGDYNTILYALDLIVAQQVLGLKT